jgi:hypothetical protein
VLRYLELEGDYIADVALNLPSFFVLRFAPGARLSATRTCNVAKWPCRFCEADGCDHQIECCENDLVASGAMIKANNTEYSAVIGGELSCNETDPSLGGMNVTFGVRAVWAIKSKGFTLSHATIRHCGVGANSSSGNVEFEGGGYGGQMSYNTVKGGSRGLWTERGMGKLSVHHNWIEQGIDCDAASGGNYFYSNHIVNCRCYGLWFEQGAHSSYSFNNTINGNAVGVYTYNAGSQVVIGNRLANNYRWRNASNNSEGQMAGGIGFGCNQATNPPSVHNFYGSNIVKINVSGGEPISGVVGQQGIVHENWLVGNEFGSSLPNGNMWSTISERTIAVAGFAKDNVSDVAIFMPDTLAGSE